MFFTKFHVHLLFVLVHCCQQARRKKTFTQPTRHLSEGSFFSTLARKTGRPVASERENETFHVIPSHMNNRSQQAIRFPYFHYPSPSKYAHTPAVRVISFLILLCFILTTATSFFASPPLTFLRSGEEKNQKKINAHPQFFPLLFHSIFLTLMNVLC